MLSSIYRRKKEKVTFKGCYTIRSKREGRYGCMADVAIGKISFYGTDDLITQTEQFSILNCPVIYGNN
jgi:hypothetical protein